jgi:hypothetical protein
MFEHGPQALILELEFWCEGLANPSYPLDQLGKLSNEVSDKFRALAIMQLLTQGSSDLFLHSLMRSGQTRETYLQRVKAAGLDTDYDRVSGRFRPLLDAIAANDLDRARRITALSPTDYRSGYESEDDYCYAELLRLWLAEVESPAQDYSALFERFERWLDGEASPRLAACIALHQRKQNDFDTALEDFLLFFELNIQADKDCGYSLGQYSLRVSRSACTFDSCRPFANAQAFCTTALQ